MLPRPSDPPFKENCRQQELGLTLLEVLTVIAIIGVVTAIVIPVVARFRVTADAVAGVSILRQIGVANLAYVNDNQGRLPGGLNLFQGAWGNTASVGLLASFLGQYMDGGIERSWNNSLADTFVPPAWRRAATPGPNGELTQALYHMNPAKIGGTALDAWQGATGSRAAFNLHTYEQASAELGANRTWMLVDLDQQSPFSGAKGNPTLVAEPIYKTFRHKLYLDAHVAREPIN